MIRSSRRGWSVALLSLLVVGLLLRSGLVYQTGSQWFDACWQNLHGTSQAAATPQQAIDQARCEPAFEKAVFGRGFVFAGKRENAVTPELIAFHGACPSLWSDVPLAGGYALAVDRIVQSGGPRIVDHLLPPTQLIARAMEEKWPLCSEVRERSGIPRLVWSDTMWSFEAPCKPCEDEKRAAERLLPPE